ncbi:UDP-N-acetylmuramoyl-L-alanyl-D-glutamate--2,6-diaminopimelate ligase [soil metagenome]
MRLKDLFEDEVALTAITGGDRDVSSIVFDTRMLKADCIFVAIRGTEADGHRFLKDAVARGAIALVVEDEELVPTDYVGFVRRVKSSREELASLAARWCRRPSKELFTVGVTGTNGKTTTTHMIEAVLNQGGIPTGVIGTIDHHFRSHIWPTDRTTPDPIVFQTRLREFADLGAKGVALEVTSHALAQSRVDAVEYDVGIFTNLTRDHLDYHGTIEAYFEAKLRFFTDLLRDSSKRITRAILNIDDVWVQKAATMLRGSTKPIVWTFGEEGRSPGFIADFEFRMEHPGFDGVNVVLRTPNGERRLRLAMAGRHNVQNAVCAYATGLAAGMSDELAASAVEKIRGVSGRLENVSNSKGLHVFVDYAHTDDALVAILLLLGEIRETALAEKRSGADAKIITVFGCGGDRDRGKRPMMMRAALNGSDTVVVTSDNPRTEDPEKIVDDAMAAVTPAEKSKVHRIVDRRQAIERAVQLARPGDVILIAGKGHEATQTIGTVKHPFSDVHVVREILKESHV